MDYFSRKCSYILKRSIENMVWELKKNKKKRRAKRERERELPIDRILIFEPFGGTMETTGLHE